MNKPNGYETVAATLSFEPLELGGHVCIVKGVEETFSKSGNEMLKIALDIGDGDKQAGYYTNRFKNDDRPNKKWPCVSYVVTTGKDGNCSKGLARFVKAIEESNPGLKFPWDNVSLLKGKKVGGIFGFEEYKGSDDKIHKAVKLFFFCAADKAKDAAIPKTKEYKPSASDPANQWADISAADIPF